MTDFQDNTTINPSQRLFADKPLDDPTLDRFGYAPFASKLADGISKMTPPDGLVMAIYGPWGCGKSTLIEFILYYLEHRSIEEKPIVMRFNPWWFSGQENLVRHFFDQLYTALGSAFGKGMRNLVSLVKSLSDILEGVPAPGFQLPKKFANRLPDFKQRDVTKIKQEIGNILRNENRKILIVIDDIDRLTAEEIRQLFALIKAVADFPNVIYLLAFERNIVSNALASINVDNDDRFMEKIVQVPFEMPSISEDSLRNLFMEKISSLVGDIPVRLFNQYFLGVEGHLQYIQPFFRTPRDIFRLINTLTVTYAAVKGEVESADFIAIEALRVFRKDLYEAIKSNKLLFTGQYEPNIGQNLIHAILRDETDHVHALIKRLFPNSGGSAFGHSGSPNWRKERRVCSPEVFDVYFRFSISDDRISHQEMTSILEFAQQGEGLSELVIKTTKNNVKKFENFLNRLWDYLGEIESSQAIALIETLLNIGDELDRIDEENHKSPDLYIPLRVSTANTIGDLSNKIDKKSLYVTLENLFNQTKSNYTVIHAVYSIGRRCGKYGGSPSSEFALPLLPEEILGLEKVSLAKIQEVLNSGASLNQRKNLDALFSWIDIDSDAAKSWLHNRLSTPSQVIEFIRRFISPIGREDYNISKELFVFYEPIALQNLIAGYIKNGDLAGTDLKIGEIFLASIQKPENSAI